METLRESFLHLTFQMSSYKRATLDEEDLADSTGDDIYPSSPMQVKHQHSAPTVIEKPQCGIPSVIMYTHKKKAQTCNTETHFYKLRCISAPELLVILYI